MGIRLFGRHDRRRHALKLMSVVLGENMSSRLFQTLREKHGLAYAIQSGVHLVDETGALGITAGLDRNRVGRALDLIFGELARLVEKPVGAQELQRAKDYAKGQLCLALESTSNQMMWVGEHILSYGQQISPEETMAALTAVTAEEIQALAADLFREPRASVAIVAPKAADTTEKRIKAAMARLG